MGDLAKRLELLSEVHELVISSESSSQLLTFLLEETDDPFLAIFCLKPDPFLIDRAPLHLDVRVCPETHHVLAKLLTFNREVFKEVTVKNAKKDVQPLLDELVSAVRTCQGFPEDFGDGIFERIRKLDLPNVLITKYDERVIYRSRTCSFVFKTDQEEVEEAHNLDPDKHCLQCRNLLVELDLKYCNGRITVKSLEPVKTVKLNTAEEENPEEVSSQKQDISDSLPKRRGRSKGKKNVLIFNDNFVSSTDLKSDDVKDELEDDEDNLNDDTVTDVDFTARKSQRKVKAPSKLWDGVTHKLKRGRPPAVSSELRCKDCGKSFYLVREFKLHCLTHKRTFTCTEKGCDKRFRLEKDLEVHVRIHRGQKPYACPDCHQEFDQRTQYKEHLKSHTGLKPFKCSQCSKAFPRAQQRDIHEVVHSGEKSHLCPECGNSFGSASTLIDHRKRIHLLIREHKCKDCPKGFFTRQELEAHIRTHTGAKPFSCRQCGKCFARTHHLKRHMDGVHRGIPAKKSKVEFTMESQDEETTFVLSTTEDEMAEGSTIILDENNQLVETEYLVDGQRYTSSLASDGTTLLIQKVDSEMEPGILEEFTSVSGEAATSLIELSQTNSKNSTNEESNFESETKTLEEENAVVVEIPANMDAGATEGFILVATAEDGTENIIPMSELQVVE